MTSQPSKADLLSSVSAMINENNQSYDNLAMKAAVEIHEAANRSPIELHDTMHLEDNRRRDKELNYLKDWIIRRVS